MSSTSVDPHRRVRVLTMNVYSPENPDWERRRRLLATAFRDVDPDVLALQEVPVTDPDALAGLTGEGYHVTHFSRHSDDGVGGIVATRWPHELVAEIDLRVSRRSRQALPWTATAVVETSSPVGRLVIAHHKPSWPFPFEAEREQQALLAATFLEDYVREQPAHVVVLGDFDATPDAASMLFWRGRRSCDGVSVCYQDAWEYVHPFEPGPTFDLANPLVRAGEVATAVTRKIDHILVRAGAHGPSLRVTDCRRVLDQPVDGVWASDHYGVMADLAAP